MVGITQYVLNDRSGTQSSVEDETAVISTEKLSAWYGSKQALFDITMDIPEKKVTAMIGPSGCGKSTLIRCFNRINDIIDGFRMEGVLLVAGKVVKNTELELVNLRRHVGMVFQKPNPFPFSIYDNLAYGCRRAGIKDSKTLDSIVEDSLRKAFLYDELKDRLEENAMNLSGGQQQRLCIARALSMNPGILLMDEPCSALDPIATAKIEELIGKLKKDYTVVIVTHNMQQATRVSDLTAFLYMGKLIEYGTTAELFSAPKHELTQNYLSGKFS